jgi:hypothetical protein
MHNAYYLFFIVKLSFIAFDTALSQGLKFEKRQFYATFATVSSNDLVVHKYNEKFYITFLNIILCEAIILYLCVHENAEKDSYDRFHGFSRKTNIPKE